LKLTTAPWTKLEPLTVNVNAPDPAVALAGCSVLIAGTGFAAALMVNVSAFDVPPPGAGFVTVTAGVPAAATSPARIAAVTFVALTKVVVRALPLKLTTAPLTKLDPLTVSVNAPDPAVALAGCRVVMAGVGLFAAALIVNVSAFDVPPPGAGFVTVTAGVPALATSPARIDAVTFVALTKVVVRALPLKLTTAPLTKLDPLTVSVSAPEPAVALAGCSVLIAGTGLFAAALMVNVSAFDVPPPGVGLVTLTAGVPTLATSVARIAAVSCVPFTNVVTRATPLNFTTDAFTKFVPFTVRVNAAEPAGMLVGESDDTDGAGFVAEPTIVTATGPVDDARSLELPANVPVKLVAPRG